MTVIRPKVKRRDSYAGGGQDLTDTDPYAPLFRLRRSKHPMHGVGSQQHLRYCRCGAMKKQGVCPRCEAT